MNKLSKSLTAGLFATALLLSGSSHATNLVVNGTFASGFANWTNFGNTGFTSTDATGAVIGPMGSDGYLMQLVQTTAGHTYDFSYSLSNDSGPLNDFAALINFNPISTSVVTNAAPFAPTDYNYIFTATGSSLISFTYRQDPGWFHLTNVAVSEVPLPASFPMFAVALVALGALAWRRRNAA